MTDSLLPYAIAWLILSILVGVAGSYRNIGFGISMLLSIFLSPLVGLIGVALSKRTDDNATKRILTEDEERKEYHELKYARDKGILSEAEFITKRDELFSSNRRG